MALDYKRIILYKLQKLGRSRNHHFFEKRRKTSLSIIIFYFKKKDLSQQNIRFSDKEKVYRPQITIYLPLTQISLLNQQKTSIFRKNQKLKNKHQECTYRQN